MGSNERSPVLRCAKIEDLPVVAELNQGLAKETEDIDLPTEVITKGVEAVLGDPSKGCYYVIELDGKVVAQLMITFEWSDWRNCRMWWIQSVFVRKEYRRKGYYKMLYKHVRDEAEKAGAGGLRLYADNENERAMKTYESMGMVSHYKVYEDLFTGY